MIETTAPERASPFISVTIPAKSPVEGESAREKEAVRTATRNRAIIAVDLRIHLSVKAKLSKVSFFSSNDVFCQEFGPGNDGVFSEDSAGDNPVPIRLFLDSLSFNELPFFLYGVRKRCLCDM